MFKTVLWIAAACAAVLVALAVSRTLHFDEAPAPPAKPPMAPAAPAAAKPAAAVAPVVPPAPPPPPTPEEQQVQDDAAATGMTTVEPEEAPKTETPPPN